MQKINQQTICAKCVLDSTVPEIVFDSNGNCNYCKLHYLLDLEYPTDKRREQMLKSLISEIKKSRRGRKYDCIVGVSGGTDSSYTLYKSVKLGLKPLAVHFDNGWNSDIAVTNIKNLCSKLNVDLVTYVVNWEEFKSLQLSFLKASVPDAEIPTDVAIHKVLLKKADEEGVKYVLNGHSFRTEGIAPVGWTYMDGKYIDSVHMKFSDTKIKSYPNFTLKDLIYYQYIKRIKVVPFLNYFDYVKSEARKVLTKEVGWSYYGGHHHESIYTQFFQSYYLPKKFNIDKRKSELSAMIRSGHISRNRALKEVQGSNYKYSQEVVDYTIKKLGLTNKEFDKIMNTKIKSFHHYGTYLPLIKALKIPVRLAYKLNLIPKLLYFKYSILLD